MTVQKPTRVHLVRHGTTLLNRANRYRGRRDVPLDAGGWQDAWTASAELEGSGAGAVYTSPLRRARDTARVVADGLGLATVTDLPGLLNLDYGAWEGLTSQEARTRDPEAFAAYAGGSPAATCPGGENLAVAAERAMLSLRLLHLLHPGEDVVAVSHAVMLRLVIAEVDEAPRHEWRRNLPNGSVSVFEVDAHGTRLVRLPAAA